MDKNHQKIKFGKYLFVLDVLGPKQIKLQVTDPNDVSGLYVNENIELQAIKPETVTAALEGVNPFIKALLKEQTPGSDEGSILLLIKVAYEFLPEINEEIFVKRQQLSDQEGLKLQLMQREKEIMDLREEFEKLSLVRKSLTQRVEKRQFSEKDEVVIAELLLDEGKYDVTASFFTTNTSSDGLITMQYFLDNEKLNKIPNSGWNMYQQNQSIPYPYTIKILIDIKGRKNLSLRTWSNDQHNWTIHNLVLSAIRVRNQ